jgi:hypothetical protein
MADLRQFLGLNITTGASSLVVFNTDRGESAQNGGRCCAYTVDGTTTRVNVELWGGGGDGNGSCCCMWPYSMPSPGQYVSTTFTVASGDILTICAGGTGCCSQNCCGNRGFASFVNRNGNTCAFANGGWGGCGLCFYKTQNCTGVCEPARRRSDSGTGNLVYCTYAGQSVTHSFCATGFHESAAGSPKYSQNLRQGNTSCGNGSWTNNGCCRVSNHFPGGGGGGGSACGGGCCWGGWGAGGLVVLTFYG